ncbi:glycosyltransferase family 62 protein [Baudoinia panamericana UAMH 10762]|uniref:Glycosyltransferase family 62 protein n=1 Tax=Baudoinia panamericana (strain UAMH 10762) TaxID=717646 RepID=M2NL91_BAUPA|nr:glycosyltransferase family 62 protein [Baudoinia panamericana UAMH 10762]EMC99925.1 glycosyltransferase family 62 protein [Baudoinia panamericana UAMH 10762]
MLSRVKRHSFFFGISIVTLWVFLTFFELRRTALSCRTVASCLGLDIQHWQGYQYPLPTAAEPLETQRTFHDGTLQFRRQLATADPEVLVLLLNRDGTSWSRDFRSGQRGAYDFADLLVSTRLNLSTVSVAMLTSSAEEFDSFSKAMRDLPLARLTIYLRDDDDQGVSYEGRHNPAVQLTRRARLATLRNYLMLSALEDERHVLWLDADVAAISRDVVQTMLARSDSTPAAGIITARCEQHNMENYDKNAWKITPETPLGPVADGDREDAVRTLVDTRLFVPAVIQGSGDDAIMPLDSVGGAILYIRSGLVRQGLTFPPYNVVGTTWSQPGWIGVETEGLCYVARQFEGGGCYVLGGSHHVRHTDWG